MFSLFCISLPGTAFEEDGFFCFCLLHMHAINRLVIARFRIQFFLQNKLLVNPGSLSPQFVPLPSFPFTLIIEEDNSYYIDIRYEIGYVLPAGLRGPVSISDFLCPGFHLLAPGFFASFGSVSLLPLGLSSLVSSLFFERSGNFQYGQREKDQPPPHGPPKKSISGYLHYIRSHSTLTRPRSLTRYTLYPGPRAFHPVLPLSRSTFSPFHHPGGPD